MSRVPQAFILTLDILNEGSFGRIILLFDHRQSTVKHPAYFGYVHTFERYQFFGSNEPNFSGIPLAKLPIDSVPAHRHLYRLFFAIRVIYYCKSHHSEPSARHDWGYGS